MALLSMNTFSDLKTNLSLLTSLPEKKVIENENNVKSGILLGISGFHIGIASTPINFALTSLLPNLN